MIEVTVAVFLITAGMLGVFALVQRVMNFSTVTFSQLAASYLAQEEIEKLRNTRDSNWLAGVVWDNNIISHDWETINFLDGSQSQFQGRATINRPEADRMTVLVEVSWSEKGRTHQVSAETELYNWR